MNECPRCAGVLRREPARLACLLCGWDAYPPAGPVARRAQAMLDRSLRSRSAEAGSRSAPSWGPALEHEQWLARHGAGTAARITGPRRAGGAP
jgi:hypothetical protein